jgi:hypothetical protein
MPTPTRFKARVIGKEFVPTMDRDLTNQCGLPVKALRLRTSVTHQQPETADPYNLEEWVPVIPSEPGTVDIITDLFVGYSDGEIHLSGFSFEFDLSRSAQLWVWTPSSQIRVNYKKYNVPRMSSTRSDARVLHQYTFPTHLQLVEQDGAVTHTAIATPTPTLTHTAIAVCAGS